jgi:hypothetical protein
MKSMGIWNSRCKEYKDSEARATAIQKLICEMRELGVEMKEEDVKTRIKNNPNYIHA